jgi:hypothetical protein
VRARNAGGVVLATAGARLWWALGAVSLSLFAMTVDGMVLSVALPTLAGALHAMESVLDWFSSGCLMLLAAAVRRRRAPNPGILALEDHHDR